MTENIMKRRFDEFLNAIDAVRRRLVGGDLG